MMKKLLLAVLMAAGMTTTAFAQATFTAKDASGSTQTFKSFSCAAGSNICSMAVPADNTGAAFGVTGNPFFITSSGTAGSASTGVFTVQGIASMTPLLVNPGTSASWGFGTAGSPSTTVMTIQGVASGTNVPTSNASGSVASGAFASGSIASGAIAAGAVAAGAYVSGSVLSGAYASGALVDITNLSAPVAPNTATATKSLLVGCQFNTTQETLTNSQQGQVACTNRGAFIVGTGADTFNVTVNAALPAGTNLMGKVGIDQTTVGTTNGVSLAQIGTATVLAGTGAVGTGAQRVAVGTDTATIAGSAPGTAGSASTNVLSVQGIASMTPILATASGTISNASSGVATASTNVGVAAYNYLWNGTTWDQGKGTNGNMGVSAGFATSTTMQTAATGSGNGTTMTVTGYSMALINVNCSVACSGGTTINFEGTDSTGTFFSLAAFPVAGSSTSVNTATTTGQFWVPVTGLTTIRARISGYSAGTITVTGTPVYGGANAAITNTSTGGTSSSFASAFPSTGTAIGVKNGSNMVNLAADSSSNLNVDMQQLAGAVPSATNPLWNAAAQATVSAGNTLNAVTSTTNGTSIAVTGFGAVLVNVNCSVNCTGGTTVNLQGADVSGTFAATGMIPAAGSTPGMVTNVVNQTGQAYFCAPNYGYTNMRATTSAYSAGTISVTLTPINASSCENVQVANALAAVANNSDAVATSASLLNSPVVAYNYTYNGTSMDRMRSGGTTGGLIVNGGAASGSAVSGNPVLIAGSDGTDARSLSTDSSGRLVNVGAGASGSALVGNPLLVAGSDGTNARNLSTDSAGHMNTNGAFNVTPTDCSSTITTGGTAQNAIAAQTTLHGFTIANVDSAHGDEVLWISFTTTAAAQSAGSYPLPPPTATSFAGFGSFTTPPGFGTSHAVSVIGSTTGHVFSCTWW